MEILEKRLRELRTERGWSQETVARKINTTLRTYCRYESDGSDPKTSALIKIADLYDVSMDYLTGRTNRREMQALGADGGDVQ